MNESEAEPTLATIDYDTPSAPPTVRRPANAWVGVLFVISALLGVFAVFKAGEGFYGGFGPDERPVIYSEVLLSLACLGWGALRARSKFNVLSPGDILACWLGSAVSLLADGLAAYMCFNPHV